MSTTARFHGSRPRFRLCIPSAARAIIFSLTQCSLCDFAGFTAKRPTYSYRKGRGRLLHRITGAAWTMRSDPRTKGTNPPTLPLSTKMQVIPQ
jgi:hypothetical protein